MTSKNFRTLAIDFGAKRIGMAISDAQKIFAFPLENILQTHDPEVAIQRIAKRLDELGQKNGWEIDEIVVGLPLNMNGSDSEGTRLAREFAQKLQEHLHIMVHLFDERLTSVQADRALQDAKF